MLLLLLHAKLLTSALDVRGVYGVAFNVFGSEREREKKEIVIWHTSYEEYIASTTSTTTMLCTV